jgi:hypothetical protein
MSVLLVDAKKTKPTGMVVHDHPGRLRVAHEVFFLG